jgi:hypothetical protein
MKLKTIQIDEKLHKELKTFCAKKGYLMKDIIEEIIKHYITDKQ